MIAVIGTGDQPCWLAEASRIFLLLLPDEYSGPSISLCTIHYSLRQATLTSQDKHYLSCLLSCLPATLVSLYEQRHVLRLFYAD